jgi:DNA-binding transcriptional MerR regulator
MYIGELARKAGTTTKAVRFYEGIGLIPRARRAPNRYRVYSEEDLARLRFIVRARRLGLAIRDIRDLLRLAAEGDEKGFRELLAAILRAKAEQVEQEIRTLEQRRDEFLRQVRRLIDDRARQLGRCGCDRYLLGCGCLQVA